MKVVCINNTVGNTRKLKLNHIYYVAKKNSVRLPDDYIILTDVIHENIIIKELWCTKECFITLEEFRSKQLKELGI